MKKIYLTLLCGMSIFALSVATTKAQTSCPGGPAAIARSFNFSGFCVVYVDHVWPNTPAVLLTASLDTMGYAIADNTGFATIIYTCSKTPYRVASCRASGCCNTQVLTQTMLPVKLTNFDAQVQGSNVVLKWNSVLELSSFKYVVQKSNDGRSFSDIGNVASAGNSNKSVEYTFSDRNFTGGTAFFRLKQVDIDGRVEFSKTVYVNLKNSTDAVIAVSPNPFISDVQLIGIATTEVTTKNIKLYNSFGQTIPYHISGANAIEIDATAAKGLYFLQVKNQTFKLIKN